MSDQIFTDLFLRQFVTKIKKQSQKLKLCLPEGDNKIIQAAAIRLATAGIFDIQLIFQKAVNVIANLPPGIKTIALDEVDFNEVAMTTHPWRAKKWSLEQTKKIMNNKYYYAAYLLRTNQSDVLVGGIDCPTGVFLKPMFQIVPLRAEVPSYSTAFVLSRDDQKFIFTDCATNVNPNPEQLAQIANNAAEFATKIGFKPQIAMLSFSTQGSAAGQESVEKVAAATKILEAKKDKNFDIIGEVQFDAAFNNKTLQKKFPSCQWTTPANIYVFPNLDAGNIGYKIAQEFGGFSAWGPILLGSAKSISDLSRGATQSDVEKTALIAAVGLL